MYSVKSSIAAVHSFMHKAGNFPREAHVIKRIFTPEECVMTVHGPKVNKKRWFIARFRVTPDGEVTLLYDNRHKIPDYPSVRDYSSVVHTREQRLEELEDIMAKIDRLVWWSLDTAVESVETDLRIPIVAWLDTLDRYEQDATIHFALALTEREKAAMNRKLTDEDRLRTIVLFAEDRMSKKDFGLHVLEAIQKLRITNWGCTE